MTTNIVTDSKKKFDFFLMNWTKTSSLAQVSILVSRCLFSLIFIMASFSHFSNQTLNYATSAGVPFASLLVPLSGVMVLLGGLSIMLGYQARFGAILIILFLVPVTLMMHKYWAISDPIQAQIQQIMFMKNLSILGGAIFIFNFGAGSLSFDD